MPKVVLIVGTRADLSKRKGAVIVIKQLQEIPRLLMDTHETARALSISERKLWELTNKGQIPCVRIGRRVLYDPRALQVWIDGRADNTAPVEAEGGV